jgi:predicted nuclease of restriction endonuclease-like (RecB) superfamily
VPNPAPEPNTEVAASAAAPALLADLRVLIAQCRETVAQTVDAALTTLHWHIGQRIAVDILRDQRAAYSAGVLTELGRTLSAEYGRGFDAKSLRHMVRFAEVFPDLAIVSALRRQLSWTHFKRVIYLDSELQRTFYTEMCRIERWSTRTLDKKINSMLFERTALSRKPEDLAAMELQQLRETDKMSPDLVFRDPYLLDFLGLRDTYAEKDLEAAILREMESFILELGHGFCFVARQQRMQIDDRDYYLDLLFYHRKLHRLVAIELKIGRFEAADKGQMELYLGWLKHNASEPGEEPPLGMILCAGKSDEHVALLEMGKTDIHVATYWTQLLPKAELERKLHQAVELARARLGSD